MKNKTLWLTWLYLFLFSCILGFIPNPDGLLKALLLLVGAGFFIPGALLLKQGDATIRRRIVIISSTSLVLTTISIILNFTSILMGEVWGTVFYILMGILSTPMLCSQIWIISLFGWACLLTVGIFKSMKKPD